MVIGVCGKLVRFKVTYELLPGKISRNYINLIEEFYGALKRFLTLDSCPNISMKQIP